MIINNHNSGIYILEIYCKANTFVDHPKLGIIELKRGTYFYVGSAQKNLQQRINRHYKRKKPLKWHIDYLTSNARFKIINHYTSLLPKEFECKVVNFLSKIEDFIIPISKFGSSDCKFCASHLLYFSKKMNNFLSYLSKNEFKFINN